VVAAEVVVVMLHTLAVLVEVVVEPQVYQAAEVLL
jgi:hypothetical protein